MRQGHWWRFSAYELHDGYFRPAHSAVLEEYDPWGAYAQARRPSGFKAPYETLLALVRRTRSRDWLLDDRTSEDLLAWCAGNGLLGVLPHGLTVLLEMPWSMGSFREFRHWPRQPPVPRRWAPPDSIAELAAGPTAVSSVRQVARDGRVFTHSTVPGTWEDMTVQTTTLDGLMTQQTDVPTAFAPYFPGWPEPEFPLPGSEQFQRHYCEPVSDFFEAASALTDGVDALFKLGQAPPMDAELQRRTEEAARLINGLLQPVRPVYQVRANGGVGRFWEAPSLISMFAFMALQDLDSGIHVKECPVCHEHFLARDRRQMYCTPRHKFRAEKSKYRKSRASRDEGSTE